MKWQNFDVNKQLDLLIVGRDENSATTKALEQMPEGSTYHRLEYLTDAEWYVYRANEGLVPAPKMVLIDFQNPYFIYVLYF